jgi:MFS family permease
MGESERSLLGAVAVTYPDFTLYQIARFFIVAALEMQSVAVGWQVYEITHRALDLGLVGLAQFLPGVFLFLVAGHAADRHDRRRLLNICYFGFILCSGLLLVLTMRGMRSVHFIYLVLLLLGVVRCFNWPASRALLPQLVPSEYFSKAVAWNASTFQSANILGPAMGGVLYAAARGPGAVYGTATVASTIALLATLRIRSKSQPRPADEMSLHTVMAGFRYVWREKVVLGSISLDMFAVLLGGAVALLPVYASDILKTGPWGLGLLRSAPGVGAAMMAIFLAKRPIRGHAGLIMLWSVAGFGVFTILFGVSRNLMLSLVALLLVGASDLVSVIIRATLVQFATPDQMRGRVNAVDMLFIGASNELGEFESGLTAHWLGIVPAVVLGGVGTLLVIAIWAWAFPELRKADQLHPAVEKSVLTEKDTKGH